MSLSLISPSLYFVELAGGFTEYVLPLGWHTSINKYISRPVSNTGSKMVTSSNSTPSPLSQSPPHAQYTSFCLIDAHSFQPRHTPFDPDQYHLPVLTATSQTVPNDTHLYRHATSSQSPTTSTTRNNDPMYQIFGDIVDTTAFVGPGLQIDVGIGFGGF